MSEQILEHPEVATGAEAKARHGHDSGLLAIGIFKALNILYSEPLADSWITLANRNGLFRGTTPLEFMLQRGLPGMLEVRRLLDARRGGQ